MEIMGKKLYELFELNMLKQGIEIDPWEDLDRRDQDAWISTAEDFLSKDF